jgi:hypothetical protein
VVVVAAVVVVAVVVVVAGATAFPTINVTVSPRGSSVPGAGFWLMTRPSWVDPLGTSW